jgi:hypothetical protein
MVADKACIFGLLMTMNYPIEKLLPSALNVIKHRVIIPSTIEKILHLKVYHYLVALIFEDSNTLYLVNMATNEELEY